jgi:hypothetical protein
MKKMERFGAPVELDDVELDAVAGGILNDINFVAAAVGNSTASEPNSISVGPVAAIVDASTSVPAINLILMFGLFDFR